MFVFCCRLLPPKDACYEALFSCDLSPLIPSAALGLARTSGRDAIPFAGYSNF